MRCDFETTLIHLLPLFIFRSNSPLLALFHHLSFAQLPRSFLRFSRRACRFRGFIYLAFSAFIYPSTSISPSPNLPFSPAFPHFTTSVSKFPTIARDFSTFIASAFSVYMCVCICACEYILTRSSYFPQEYFSVIAFLAISSNFLYLTALPYPYPFFCTDLCFRRAGYPRFLELRWYLSVSYC